ncbi:hypothetical protein Tco_0029236 [Tanacetum coccineum]
MTAALSIEIGSLFEGESEFEKLKIYLITLVSIRSDWEDLPWLFRSVENLKPQDSDASASKQHLTLTSTGWQITDTRDAVIDSSMHNFEPESGHSEHASEHSSGDISKQDEGHVSDLEDTDNAHIPKVKAATWFKPIQEDERPATPEPEWTIPPNDFPEPENNWANAYATSYQVPAKNKL